MAGAFQTSAFQNSAFQVGAVTPPASTVTHNFAGPPHPRKQRSLYSIEGRSYWLTIDELRFLLQQMLARSKRPAKVLKAIARKPEIVEQVDAPPAAGPALFVKAPEQQLQRARRIELEIAPQDPRVAQFLADLIAQLELRADLERDDEEVLLLIA